MSTGGGSLAPIQRVFAMAKTTFARSTAASRSDRGDTRKQHMLDNDEFSMHLKELSALMNNLTAKDLGLDQSVALQTLPTISTLSTSNGVSSKATVNGGGPRRRAPVTYIALHEEEDFTMGVFIINPRGRMPLHNHPEMHGILKMLHGTVEVSFYNRVKELLPEDVPEALRSRLDLIDKDIVVPTLHPVRVTVEPDSEPLILYPDKDNFHEIRLVEGSGPAAFLDILSPPYNSINEEDGTLEIPDDDRRDCGFFKNVTHSVGDGGNPDITWLHRLRSQPPDYFCDQEPYKGPNLKTQL